MEGLAVSALQELAPEAIDLDDLFNSARNWMPDEGGGFAGALEAVRRKGVSLGTRPGRMYEVDIGHKPEQLLNYDRPFDDIVGSRAAAVLRDHNPAAISPRTLREIETGEWRFVDHAYGNPYQRAATELHGLARTKGGAEALREGGIPGLRYLDQGSRSTSDGTRNYVMFPGTEDSIRILRKYAIPGAVGTGVASQYGEE
jgi:hypothetical protein